MRSRSVPVDNWTEDILWAAGADLVGSSNDRKRVLRTGRELRWRTSQRRHPKIATPCSKVNTKAWTSFSLSNGKICCVRVSVNHETVIHTWKRVRSFEAGNRRVPVGQPSVGSSIDFQRRAQCAIPVNGSL